MKENKLLASVVLFRELYDSEKDIYDVIGEFLKAAIVFEKKWSFNTTEATQLLETAFGFYIPEAVVKTTLKNRLKKNEKILSFNDGVYSLVSDDIKEKKPLSSELDLTKHKQDKIIKDLVVYIENLSNSTLEEVERKSLINNFCCYLLDNKVSEKYSKFISSYIIERQGEDGFRDSLNAVREGFVLYNGVSHSANLSDLGTWKSELTIYLDTEYLFNAAGYSGALHKQLFDDFHRLVKEVNQVGKRLINLKYFEECSDEIDSFFHVAERIIDGKVGLDPSKSAMLAILNGCETKSDIVSAKANFYSKLSSMRISLESEIDFYSDQQYNIEGTDLIGNIKDQIESNGWKVDEGKVVSAIRNFTKINVLRRGNNSVPFDKVGSILMSGKKLTNFMAFNRLIKPDSKDIPFSTDIDFITNRLWFKLNKGLAHHSASPTSLDVVAKAQVVLSSQISRTVSDKFDSMKEDLSCGKITKEEAEYLHNELRKRTTAPENITPENVGGALEYLGYFGYEDHLREKSLLEKKAAEGAVAIKKIEDIKDRENEIRIKKVIFWAKVKIGILLSISALFAIFCYLSLFYLLYLFITPADSPLTIFGLVISIVIGTIPFFKYKGIKNYFEGRYACYISKL